MNERAVLLQISRAVVVERNPDHLLEAVLDILSREMGMLRATFTFRHNDVFQIEASRGLDAEQRKKGRYHAGEGITGTVAATGKPALVSDIAGDKNFLNRTGSHKAGEHVAFLCVPVLRHDQIVGTLSIERKLEPETDLNADLELLQIIGNLVAEAVAVSRQEREEHRLLQDENQRLRYALSEENPGKIIGNSRQMREVYRFIRMVAPTDATVLIRGSSGTGKELVAKAVRQLSHRANGPFVTLNCAAIPESLVESELFGHEKGSFTGAVTKRTGRVEAAGGGTLFLDEIGDLSLHSQIKMLRFLQERTYSRVGSNEERKADVRVIAATSRNLEEMMTNGLFREDLFYRLNIFPIQLPDLSQRRSDIILLAEHFIAKYNLRYGKEVKKLSTTAVNLLMDYHWPGNVRELENCIERAILTAMTDSICDVDLPPSLQSGHNDVSVSGSDFKSMVDSFQRKLIVEALRREKGNQTAAARVLQLSPRMMHYNIERLEIDPNQFKESQD
ncbi:MAG: sigma 54-interacting transcriptional regulator [Planctomycetia bacterium]|nr:sigma 54-interacting transcriptional regulator [Planctomycetia bacterium]